MRQLIRKIVPGSLYSTMSVLKGHRRGQARDAFFRENAESFVLDPTLFENLRVLPNRRALLQLVPRGGIIAEIGVASGEFSRKILEICAPTKLYLIDLWASDSGRYADLEPDVRAAMADELSAGIVEIRRGYSWDMVSALPDNSLDFVYVDAAHDYNSVYKDLRACAPKIKTDGMLAGHDYTRWASNGFGRWGVVEAVNEFANENGWELLFLTNEPHRHLSYALRRRDAEQQR